MHSLRSQSQAAHDGDVLDGEQALARPFSITYGTGEVTGRVGYDTVTLGDRGSLSIISQGFGQVLSSSSDFLTASCDGLFVRSPLLRPA